MSTALPTVGMYVDMNVDVGACVCVRVYDADERPTFMPLPDSGELLWFSERSGWAHLYLYDLETGKLKNAVTQGDWGNALAQRASIYHAPVLDQILLWPGGTSPPAP